MNTPVTRYRIGLYIEVPGLKMNPLAAAVLTVMFCDPIRRALESQNLLLRPLLPKEVQEDLMSAAKQIDAVSKKAPPGDREASAMIASVSNSLLKSIEESGFQMCAYFNWFFILADVADAAFAALAVKTELLRLNLLQHAEIACICLVSDECVCVPYWPADCATPFERRFSLVKQLEGYGRNLLREAAA